MLGGIGPITHLLGKRRSLLCNSAPASSGISDGFYPVQQQGFYFVGGGGHRGTPAGAIEQVANTLEISTAASTILLLYHKWRVTEACAAWVGGETEVRSITGLLKYPVSKFPKSEKLTCQICLDEVTSDEMKSTSCGHLFCVQCWQVHISGKIKDGLSCLKMRCPHANCCAAVDRDMINVLASDEDKRRYSWYLLRSYTEISNEIKWCPAPGCIYAFSLAFNGDNESYNVTCFCSYSFCWKCTNAVHRPVDCERAREWISKITAETDPNSVWVKENSKPCPKCERPIDRDEGCYHMTCVAPCDYHFCWICLNAWSSHNDYYSCPLEYKLKKQKIKDEERRNKEENRFKKYSGFWKKYQTLEDSAYDSLLIVLKLNCEPVSDLKIMTEAWQKIVECRIMQKWTYVYGFYLPANDHKKREYVKHLQGQAKEVVGRLCIYGERVLENCFRPDGPLKELNPSEEVSVTMLAGQTRLTKKHFEDLMEVMEISLPDVTQP